MNPVFIPPIRVVHVNKNNSVKERISEKRQAMQYSNVYTQWWLWKEQSTKSFLPYMRNKVTQTAKGSETSNRHPNGHDGCLEKAIDPFTFFWLVNAMGSSTSSAFSKCVVLQLTPFETG